MDKYVKDDESQSKHADTNRNKENTQAEDKREAVPEGKKIRKQAQEKFAEQLERIGQAFTKSAEELQSGDADTVAGRMTNSMGDRFHSLAQYVRDHQGREFIDDLAIAVRKNPGVILGGTFLAGLGVARFLRASSFALKGPKSNEGERAAESSSKSFRSSSPSSSGTIETGTAMISDHDTDWEVAKGA